MHPHGRRREATSSGCRGAGHPHRGRRATSACTSTPARTRLPARACSASSPTRGTSRSTPSRPRRTRSPPRRHGDGDRPSAAPGAPGGGADRLRRRGGLDGPAARARRRARWPSAPAPSSRRGARGPCRRASTLRSCRLQRSPRRPAGPPRGGVGRARAPGGVRGRPCVRPPPRDPDAAAHPLADPPPRRRRRHLVAPTDGRHRRPRATCPGEPEAGRASPPRAARSWSTPS